MGTADGKKGGMTAYQLLMWAIFLLTIFFMLSVTNVINFSIDKGLNYTQ
ncbi:MAG: hypothetical protein ABIH34_05700 [Nanoarchaeota archaeon]